MSLLHMLILFSLTVYDVLDYTVLCFVQIDAVSGVLRIRKELDFEKQQFFNLTLLAEDRGVPSLTSQTFVEVEVCNTHTHTICFERNSKSKNTFINFSVDIILFVN